MELLVTYGVTESTPKEAMINNTSTKGREKSPTKRYWISTYVLGFIAVLLLYYIAGYYFSGDIQLRSLFVESFITHNIFYYLIIYRRGKSQSS